MEAPAGSNTGRLVVLSWVVSGDGAELGKVLGESRAILLHGEGFSACAA